MKVQETRRWDWEWTELSLNLIGSFLVITLQPGFIFPKSRHLYCSSTTQQESETQGLCKAQMLKSEFQSWILRLQNDLLSSQCMKWTINTYFNITEFKYYYTSYLMSDLVKCVPLSQFTKVSRWQWRIELDVCKKPFHQYIGDWDNPAFLKELWAFFPSFKWDFNEYHVDKLFAEVWKDPENHCGRNKQTMLDEITSHLNASSSLWLCQNLLAAFSCRGMFSSPWLGK